MQVGIVSAFYLRFLGTPPMYNFSAYLKVAPWLALITVLTLNAYGLYDTRRKPWSEVLASLISSSIVILIASLATSYVSAAYAFPRSVYLIGGILYALLLITWRFFAWRIERGRVGSLRVLLVGERDEVESVIERLGHGVFEFYTLTGIVLTGPAETQTELCSLPVLGKHEEIPALLGQGVADALLVCPGVKPETKAWLTLEAVDAERPVYLIPDLYDIFLAGANLHQIDDLPVLMIRPPRLPEGQALLKRALDVLLATVGLVLGLPFMLLIAFAIWVTSWGPVLYVQERVGLNGRRFQLIKFRSMVPNAEKDIGPVMAEPSDSRVTPLGRFLRTTHLDELPQLINILRGDMSFVGPRPERPYFVGQILERMPGYAYRSRLKAGLTGLAQVAGKYATPPEDKLRYDLLYAQRYSLLLDVQVFFHTLRVLFLRGRAQ